MRLLLPLAAMLPLPMQAAVEKRATDRPFRPLADARDPAQADRGAEGCHGGCKAGYGFALVKVSHHPARLAATRMQSLSRSPEGRMGAASDDDGEVAPFCTPALASSTRYRLPATFGACVV